MTLLPKRWKRSLQGKAKQLRTRFHRWRHGFGVEELDAALRAVGVGAGDVTMAQFSWDSFLACSDTVSNVIRCLQDVVGNNGTLLMPTMPFLGSAIEYVEGRDTIDLHRAPSMMGLPTELFRRMPGVVRSVHPTHPVAAWGAHAVEMTRDHHACETPCGRASPFGRLLDHDGKILFLGPTIESMTFFHTAEEILEQRLPRSPFTTKRYALKTKDREGKVYETRTRLFERETSRMRRISRMVPILKEANQWHIRRLGTLEILRLDARAVLDAFATALERGVAIYDDGTAE